MGNSSKKVCFRGLIETTEADFGDFDFEAICETALACESEPYGGLIDRISRDTVPLKSVYLIT
jgi:hypothetical protein